MIGTTVTGGSTAAGVVTSAQKTSIQRKRNKYAPISRRRPSLKENHEDANIDAVRERSESDLSGSVSPKDKAVPILNEGMNQGKTTKSHLRRLSGLSSNLLSGFKAAGLALINPGDILTSPKRILSNSNEASKISELSNLDLATKPSSEASSPVSSKARQDLIPDDWSVMPYTVKPSDTIAGIAMRNGMTTAQFMRLNKLYGRNLYFGQNVYVAMPKEKVANWLKELDQNDTIPALQEPKSVVRSISKLGGTLFEDVILVDKKIQLSGLLEINPLYISYRPKQFMSTENERRISGCASLLNSYSFRVDWRDISSCLPLRRIPKSEQEDLGSYNSVSSLEVETKADGAKIEEAAENDETPKLNNTHQPFHKEHSMEDVLSLRYDDDDETTLYKAQMHDNILLVQWWNANLGFTNKRNIVFAFQATDCCYDASKIIDEHIQHERKRAAMYKFTQSINADTLTTGALVGGLMFKSDLGEEEILSPTQTLDRVDQSYLNGKITKEESLRLRRESLDLTLSQADETHTKKGSKLAKRKPSKSETDVPVLAFSKKRVPRFSGTPSSILTDEEHMSQLCQFLPIRLRSHDWNVIYQFETCGASLKNLYESVRGHSETIMLVKTQFGDVFGVFATEEWTPTKPKEYYGTGETFLFELDGPDVIGHKWTGSNEFYLASSSSHIAVGGGSNGFAFCLDDFLERGTSNPCETFGIERPISKSASEFKVTEVEVLNLVLPQRKASHDSSGCESLPSVSLFQENPLKIDQVKKSFMP